LLLVILEPLREYVTGQENLSLRTIRSENRFADEDRDPPEFARFVEGRV
jgi:hypothetical protein